MPQISVEVESHLIKDRNYYSWHQKHCLASSFIDWTQSLLSRHTLWLLSLSLLRESFMFVLMKTTWNLLWSLITSSLSAKKDIIEWDASWIFKTARKRKMSDTHYDRILSLSNLSVLRLWKVLTQITHYVKCNFFNSFCTAEKDLDMKWPKFEKDWYFSWRVTTGIDTGISQPLWM